MKTYTTKDLKLRDEYRKNMQLEKQVVSLELAKRLKELNCPQESLFYWSDSDIYTDEKVWCVNYRAKVTKRNGEPLEWYSAYTVAELGEMLPQIEIEGVTYVPLSYQFAGKDGYECDLLTLNLTKKPEIYTSTIGTTEADARAKMLIYLIENNLIDIKTLT